MCHFRLLQHKRREIPLQYRIFNRIEHNLDILRIYGVGEVMVDRLWWLQALELVIVVAADAEKHLQDEGLDVDDRVRISGVLRIIPANVSLRVLHFQCQQIRFVEKKNDRNVLEGVVVDYRVKNVFRLLETIRFPKSEDF